jgi:6-pyruvoyl-tetrahydropterin synthase
MGVDYGLIKEQVLKTIEDIFDHKIILFKDDPLVKVLRKFGTEVVTMEQNPTSEAIAKYIFDFASNKLNTKYPDQVQGILGEYMIEVLEVTVDETCTSSCRVVKQ